MKRALSIGVVALAATLALQGCGQAPASDTNGNAIPSATDNGAVNIPGLGMKKCIRDSDINVVGVSSYELKGELRARFLTGAAQQAGIRVFTSNTTVTDYGSQMVYYYAPDGICLIWAESLTLQEYGTKLGLDPLGVSPFYEPETKTVETK